MAMICHLSQGQQHGRKVIRAIRGILHISSLLPMAPKRTPMFMLNQEASGMADILTLLSLSKADMPTVFLHSIIKKNGYRLLLASKLLG